MKGLEDLNKLNYKKIFVCVFTAGTFVFNFSSAYGAKSISELNKERQSIKNQSEAAKSSLSQTQKEKSSVLAEVERLDGELNRVESEIERLTNELDETRKRLEKSEEDLEQATEDRENQYETLKSRIRAMYENGTVGYLQIILESESFSDFLRRIEYINRLMEYDQDVLTRYEQTERKIEETVKNIEKEKANIEQLSEEQKNKKASLDESLKIKEDMVKKLSTDEAKYMQQLKDLDDADKDVQALISKAQAEAARKKAAEEAKRAAGSSSSSGSSSTKVYSYSGGKLQYPVPAYSGYSPNSPYGYRSSPISGKSEFHTGVDLKATRNTDIVAAEAGTVIYAGAKGGYGNTVIIDHGGGMSTLYAHNTSLCVSVGQSVSRGQVVAKAGTTGYSTGVHCHFEVRINGSHTNPMPYLRG